MKCKECGNEMREIRFKVVLSWIPDDEGECIDEGPTGDEILDDIRGEALSNGLSDMEIKKVIKEKIVKASWL